jgi:enamine deaminase RidA (YjgF/YER057c/UK114 family)
VVSNGLVFTSGVRGQRRDARPAFKDLPAAFRGNGFSGFPIADRSEADFAADGWCTHDNLERVLKAAGSDALQVLRMHIWMRDKRVFPVYERIRMAAQKVPAPSSCLGVSEVVGRFSGAIGMDAIAVVPGESSLFPERSAIRAFDNPNMPSAAFYSQAARCGPLAFLAGHIPIDTSKPGWPVISGFKDVPENGRGLATGRSHTDSRQGPIAAQTWFTYECIRETLAAQGLRMEDVRHVSVMLRDVRDFGTFHRVHRQFFPDTAPALVVAGFDEVGHRGTMIEIEPTAIDPRAGVAEAFVPWPVPAPFSGPAAVRLGPFTMTAGMLGLDERGDLVRDAGDLGDDLGRRVAADLARFEASPGFAAQCWAAWTLLRRVCESAGLSPDRLVKTTVSLRSARDIWIYEEIRDAFIPDIGASLPAIEFVGIENPGPVSEAQIQIEAVAADD